MFRLRAVVAACAAMAVLLVLAPPNAGAQSAAHVVKLVEVDSTDPSNVVVTYRYDGADADVTNANISVLENGKKVDVRSAKAQRPIGVVFVVDTSASTDASGVLAEARNAVKPFVASLRQGTQFAVIAAGADALLVQRFTTDTSLVTKAMSGLTPIGDGALWEGVTRANREITSVKDMVGTIVLITDGNNGKGTLFSSARGALIGSGVSAYVVGVDAGKLGSDPQSLADSTGGAFATSTKAADETQLLAGFTPQIKGLYSTAYTSTSGKGINDLQLSIGDASTKGSYLAGSDVRGATALAYQPPTSASGITAFQNNFGKYLAIVLGLLAAGLAAYAIASIVVKDTSGLASVLQPYSEGYVARSADDDEEGDGDQSIAQTAMVQRAVEITRQFAERRGFLSWVEAALERANLPLRAAEAIFFYVAAAAIVALLSAVITRNFFLVLIVIVLVGLAPIAALSFLSNRRRTQFQSMLPDTLQLLSGTLRAGYSMMQGVEAVSQEVSEPMGRELRRVVTEARLGRPLEESLDSVAERMGSPDFAWAVMAIRIQREVGGNLSELLMTVADTMTQRERLRRDVKSLTAEGRISAYVLAVLPVALGFAMYVLNPDYMQALFDETVGKAMLAGGVLMMIAGFAWMQAIVKIDV